ncbi:MAG TPA: DegV family protein [Anaerolineae bacterium]|nr:DegV family protein [Anaerolineae bacterium]HQK15115.1 DegV family protein [Anaerolineae bacterium]
MALIAMNNPRVRVITDSVADIPPQLTRQLGIKVVPIHLTLGKTSYLVDGATDDHDWFYRELVQSSVSPKTASPAPEEFLKLYRELISEGAEDIIGLFASANVSSLCDHALLAARELSGARVSVIDTGQISMGIGWLALMAAEAAARGASLEEIEALVKAARGRTQVFGLLDTSEYLRRSGRVSWATTQLVNLLQIKPMIVFAEGEARLIGRVRTHQRALQRMVDLVQTITPLERLAVLHAHTDLRTVMRLRDALLPYAPEVPPPVIEVGPIFGAHVGPGAVGVALVRKSAATSL